eukprot:jgi/Mesvir1/24078/Mv10800-RA.1
MATESRSEKLAACRIYYVPPTYPAVVEVRNSGMIEDADNIRRHRALGGPKIIHVKDFVSVRGREVAAIGLAEQMDGMETGPLSPQRLQLKRPSDDGLVPVRAACSPGGGKAAERARASKSIKTDGARDSRLLSFSEDFLEEDQAAGAPSPATWFPALSMAESTAKRFRQDERNAHAPSHPLAIHSLPLTGVIAPNLLAPNPVAAPPSSLPLYGTSPAAPCQGPPAQDRSGDFLGSFAGQLAAAASAAARSIHSGDPMSLSAPPLLVVREELFPGGLFAPGLSDDEDDSPVRFHPAFGGSVLADAGFSFCPPPLAAYPGTLGPETSAAAGGLNPPGSRSHGGGPAGQQGGQGGVAGGPPGGNVGGPGGRSWWTWGRSAPPSGDGNASGRRNDGGGSGGGGSGGGRSPPGNAAIRDKSASLGPLRVGVCQARGARPYMEDRHAIVTNFAPTHAKAKSEGHTAMGVQRSFFGLYDGHNGPKAADYAASRLHILLAADMDLPPGGATTKPAITKEEQGVITALKNAFKKVDVEIIHMTRSQGTRDGSTAIVAFLLGSTLYVANAGDCRCVMACRGGRLERLSVDHKPNLPSEKERVERLGGRVEWSLCWRVAYMDSPVRLAISRSLGDLDFKSPAQVISPVPDVMITRLQPEHDFIIMASDGLWDVVEDALAVRTVRQILYGAETASRASALNSNKAVAGRDPRAMLAAETLVGLALKQGSMDNVTVIIVQFVWD